MNVFIDTQDMEERYGEQLYMDYLKEQNQQLKSTLEEIREYIKSNYDFYYGDELYSEYEHILQIIDKGVNNV